MSTPRKTVPLHVAWLVDTGRTLKTTEGRRVRVLEFRHANDANVFSAWAKHFRNHYCDDAEIDALRKGTRLSRAEYLREMKFPDRTSAPGPSIRAGDFGEILVADYLEFALDYCVPRTRYDNKAVRNESTKGSDTIGFKIVTPGRDDPDDELAVYETKARLTATSKKERLQAAVDDSGKDQLRKAESLNAIKQRYLRAGLSAEVDVVERFQNPEDRPHKEQYGAVALVSSPLFDRTEIRSTKTASHPHSGSLTLIVIHGPDLMRLVHELYRRAADEA